MATQSIIVYRNPGEEAVWNMITSGYMIPILVGVLWFFAATWFFGWALPSRFKHTMINFWCSVISSIPVTVYLFSKIY